MQFPAWQTAFKGTEPQWCQYIKENMGDNRARAEFLWVADGCPFYNVHPLLVPHLLKVDLDTIPTDLIEVPDNFCAVNIRFAERHPELTFHETVSLRVIRPKPKTQKIHGVEVESSVEDDTRDVPKGSFVSNALMVEPGPVADGKTKVDFKCFPFLLNLEKPDGSTLCMASLLPVIEGSIENALCQNARGNGVRLRLQESPLVRSTSRR